MSKAVLGMIEQLGAEVEAATDPWVRAQVLAGCEAITGKTSGAQVALWARGAMERLDALVSAEARVQIMENCGVNCARESAVSGANECRFRITPLSQLPDSPA